MSVYKAAIEAGDSESYAKSNVIRLFENESMRSHNG